MLPPAGTCHGCSLRDREIRRLHERLRQKDTDMARLERRCARLKKDNNRLRAELDETRRQSHRQANPFRRRQHKKRKKKPGQRPGHQAKLRPTPEHVDRVLEVPCRLCPECHVERREQLSAAAYERRVQDIEFRFDAWLAGVARARTTSPELERLFKHRVNHHGEWLVLLREPEVPPTNNQAERMLRPAVITRKVGGCNKTLLGALVHSILASLMVTCRQQGQQFLDLARQLWASGEPQAIPLVTVPQPAANSA